MKALLLGFGQVGRRLVEILAETPENTAGRSRSPGLAALDLAVVGIVTGRHGALANPRGLDLAEVLAAFSAHGCFPPEHPDHARLGGLEAVRTLDYDVLVEMTPLAIRVI